jgi:cation transporter-like permease
MLEKFNVPDEEMDKALERTEDQMANQYKIGGIMKAYLYSIIIYAVISLITGAIIKKRNPEETV